MQNNPSSPGPQQPAQPEDPLTGSIGSQQNTVPLPKVSLNDPVEPPLNNTSRPTQTPSLRVLKPMRNDYPPKLALVDNGKIVETLKIVRERCEEISPGEIYLVLNPSGVTEAAEAQFSQKAHSIEGWRNSLILLPIMVTWISLGLASLAYTQSIAANSKLAAAPFLQQWADGFTALNYISVWTFHLSLIWGRWRYFSFGDVAFLDFLLFVALLILTMWAHGVEAQAAKDANELGTWLREECDILREHTYAQHVGPGYGGDTPQWAMLVNKSIANLQGVMLDVTTLIRSFGEVLRDDRETVSKALAAVDNLNAIYESGRRTYEKLDAILVDMNTNFGMMTNNQTKSVESLDKIATAITASSDAVVQLTQPFATIGVAQVARETFSNLQQAQSQQKYINDLLAKQLAMAGQIHFSSQYPSTYQWWDIRRFFPRSRRRP